MARAQAQNLTDNHAETDELREYAKKATEVAQSAKQEARSLVDNVVTYAKANPLEAMAIAAGVAFVAGAVIVAPRLLKGPTREEQIKRLLSDAYREAERVRDDAPTWNRLSEWVKSNVPSYGR